MSLYTDRHGLRKPIERTSEISKEVYSLLLDICRKYYKNLTHIFSSKNHCSFMGQDYIEFNKSQFENRMTIKIPNLFRDDNEHIGVPEDRDTYDQYSLIDFIEYIGQNIMDISEGWNNPNHKNYWAIYCLETANVFKDYQREINEIFQESGIIFRLTDEKIIERIMENSIITSEMEDEVQRIAEDGIKELLNDAIVLYKTPNPASRQDSVEKIWDALERLKTYYVDLEKTPKIKKPESANKIIDDMSNGNEKFKAIFQSEFLCLRDIGNNFRIRHHETYIYDITDNRYYDYLFNRCLSLIALAIQYLEERGELK